jgi:hypothetical protein
VRLRRITWRTHGNLAEWDEIRERFDFFWWLEERGARVSRWMLTWNVRWP